MERDRKATEAIEPLEISSLNDRIRAVVGGAEVPRRIPPMQEGKWYDFPSPAIINGREIYPALCQGQVPSEASLWFFTENPEDSKAAFLLHFTPNGRVVPKLSEDQ